MKKPAQGGIICVMNAQSVKGLGRVENDAAVPQALDSLLQKGWVRFIGVY
jgi:hypothetical protein